MPPLSDLEARIDSMFGTSDGEEVATPITEDSNGGTPTTNDSAEVPAEGTPQQDAQSAGQQQPVVSTSTDAKPATQPTVERPNSQPTTPPVGRLPANSNGDLVDSRGQVIAKAGNERRFYETARNAQVQEQRLRGEVERVSTELKAFRDAAVLPQQLGLQPVEVANAMQFMAHFKANPLEAAKKVFAELQAMGHNLEGITGSVDMAAIKQMVTEAVSPFANDRSQLQQQQQIANAVNAEIATVQQQFDWVQHQEEALESVLAADPKLSLREAAMLTENFALRNGYDLTKPLREQHLAAISGQPQLQPVQQVMSQRVSNAAMQPAPAATASDAVVPRRTTAAPVDRSHRDIIRETMSEAGYNMSNI